MGTCCCVPFPPKIYTVVRHINSFQPAFVSGKLVETAAVMGCFSFLIFRTVLTSSRLLKSMLSLTSSEFLSHEDATDTKKSCCENENHFLPAKVDYFQHFVVSVPWFNSGF
jgi:hypothetical protein